VMNGGTHSASSLAAAAVGTLRRRRVGWNLLQARAATGRTAQPRRFPEQVAKQQAGR
jgi:hypothetical protein